MTRALVAALAVALASFGTRAQVAVVAAIDDKDVAQRELAAHVVAAARARWQVLTPGLALAPGDCDTSADVDCLKKRARAAGATHMLVVNVATLGVRNHVVSVQLFALDTTAPLFDQSAVQFAKPGAPDAVLALSGQLADVAGPPAAPAQAPRPPAARGAGALTWVGTGLVAAGVVAAGVTTLASLSLVGKRDYDGASNVGWVGIVGSGALLAAGAGVLGADAL